MFHLFLLVSELEILLNSGRNTISHFNLVECVENFIVKHLFYITKLVVGKGENRLLLIFTLFGFPVKALISALFSLLILSSSYMKEGMRTSVEAILLVLYSPPLLNVFFFFFNVTGISLTLCIAFVFYG